MLSQPRALCTVGIAPGAIGLIFPTSGSLQLESGGANGSLHIGDLQVVVSFQATLLWPALGIIVPAVFILKRAVVIVEISLFAAEAPSYLPQGKLRRQE